MNNEDISLTGMLDDDTINKLEELSRQRRCLWHKSESIENSNEMYDSCQFECNGYDTGCVSYQPTGKVKK